MNKIKEYNGASQLSNLSTAPKNAIKLNVLHGLRHSIGVVGGGRTKFTKKKKDFNKLRRRFLIIKSKLFIEKDVIQNEKTKIEQWSK